MPIAEINGLTVNYRVQGQGEPLLLISGFGGDHRDWLFQIPTFKKHFRVITFDNRGSGKSDKPEGPYSTALMAEDTVGLMDSLGLKKANILGMSMGGAIAQEIAINHPERVIKLVLVGAWSHNKEASCGLTPELEKAMQMPVAKIVDSTMDLAFNRKLFRIIILPLLRFRNKRLGSKIFPGVLGQKYACLTHDSSDRLNLIIMPTLIITGNKDRCIKPSSSEVMAKQIPGSKLLKIDSGSHSAFIEVRGRFNREVLNFLRNS